MIRGPACDSPPSPPCPAFPTRLSPCRRPFRGRGAAGRLAAGGRFNEDASSLYPKPTLV